jgi:DNA-binding NarL/FixJ family response regulator
MVEAVRSVHNGKVFLCHEISEVLVKHVVTPTEAQDVDPIALLSPREREILQLLLEGKSNARIADALCLSPKTVETYRSHLMKKLGISDLATLVKFGIQHGLISLE